MSCVKDESEIELRELILQIKEKTSTFKVFVSISIFFLLKIFSNLSNFLFVKKK